MSIPTTVAGNPARIIKKIAALRQLCDKYSPGIDPEAEIARFIKTVCIVRIDIDSVNGKEAIELTRARTNGQS